MNWRTPMSDVRRPGRLAAIVSTVLLAALPLYSTAQQDHSSSVAHATPMHEHTQERMQKHLDHLAARLEIIDRTGEAEAQEGDVLRREVPAVDADQGGRPDAMRGLFQDFARAGRHQRFAGVEVPVGALDITFYRDDMGPRSGETRAHPQPVVKASSLDFPLDGATVVIVDDVLYTGRTVRAAIEAVFDYGRPAHVRLAVLCDRGHRELPIRADVVGKNLPTSRAERVRVHLGEDDAADEVVLERSSP